MDSELRLFLDIKRELEYKITELKESSNSYFEKTIEDLKQQNILLNKKNAEHQEEINTVEEKIKMLIIENQIENNFLRSELEKYKSREEQLLLQLKAIQESKKKKSFFSGIINLFKKGG